ncbi:hypothetical protein BDP55DRAFT_632514 [Colletotrichum godetiae]|uniref:Uncharacterized protein n=1 Tax=Colletotrichum godetiae TaxID=1209918 RepID=A0AAJ0AJ54_9PEZI|nr:uncharacterized protein BDP55DRAFT_632514 [Colletotrichum godetiae]KAK1674861.1 hypothetical protein BDP55DRAFT_632514 [Colletotrichum godetiae]
MCWKPSMVHRECQCVYDEMGVRYCDEREQQDHVIELRQWPVDMPCQTHRSDKWVPFSTSFFDRASEFENESYLDSCDGDSTSDDSSCKTGEVAHHMEVSRGEVALEARQVDKLVDETEAVLMNHKVIPGKEMQVDITGEFLLDKIFEMEYLTISWDLFV